MRKIPRIDRNALYSLIPQLLVLFTAIFLIFPLIFAVIISFTEGPITFPPSSVSLKWYLPLFSREDFLSSLSISLIVGIISSAISLGIGIPASLVMVRRKFFGSDLLQILFLSPLVIPTVVIGVALLQLFSSLQMYDPLVRLLVGHVLITLPYVIRVISASLVGLDRRIEEAALSLGANEVTTFTKITIPLIKSGIVAAIVFAIQISFNDVAVSVFLGGTNFTTLPVILMSWTYKHFDPSIAAVSGIVIASITIIMLITEKVLGIDKLMGAFTGI